MSQRNIEGEGSNTSYFNIRSPIQGLTVAAGGTKIISCIIKKISQVRGSAKEESPDDNNNTGKKRYNKESLLNLVLDAFIGLQVRITQVQLFSTAAASKTPNHVQASGMEENTTKDDPPTNNDFIDTQLQYSLNVTRCRHQHHAHISTWKHAISVHRSHVPKKLQEPFIEHGYFLPYMPWSYYLKGLYVPSYELMNVWTHLIPSIYFFYLLYSFSQEVDVYRAWPLFFLTMCAAFMTGFSAMAHLFHSRSCLHHSCWFISDYFGITLYAFASILSSFYTGALLKYYKMLSCYYLSLGWIICIGGYSCLCITQTGHKWAQTSFSRQLKVYINGLGYFFGVLPIFQRMYENILEDRAEPALWYHGIAMIAMIMAPILYGSDFPQRFSPGTFDVFGHSHSLFHIFTAMAGYCDIYAVYYDVTDGPWNILHQQEDYPSINHIILYYAALIVYGVVAGFAIRYVIKEEHAHEEPLLQGKIRCDCGLPETAKYQRKEE